MRFLLGLLPGATAAALFEHSLVNCKPFKLLAPDISGLSHVAFALSLALVFVTAGFTALSPRPAWSFASLLAGLIPFSLPCVQVVRLSHLTSSPHSSEFTWQAAANLLPRTVLGAAGPAFALALVAGAVLLVLERRATA